MTVETTQFELAAGETEKFNELIGRAKCVLFDFDGPICRLFAGRSAKDIAAGQEEWLAARGLAGVLAEGERGSRDPHWVLSEVAGRHPDSDLVVELEEWLTQQELRAVACAMPTAYADPLIRTWGAVGARLAVVTNNSGRAVRAYLESRHLVGYFAPNIYGRTRDLSLLKPHPYTLNRALSALGAAPDTTLMIGDTPSDHAAAVSAGVHFLGYARNARKAELLLAAGVARWNIVHSLDTVLRVVRGGAL
ncbi:HAD family hydrolase [Streptomyces aurantiacus]|uniref:Hydrolase n=1 Tax=Streptomyces aurantiacus TaxID=47760 RepID=A0A7G1P2V9_9ACTN|nr:HAD family hydrolase [Streptomyces aurantiacus]BCL29011.1 hydrolase [Streptomyces aurantiacus]